MTTLASPFRRLLARLFAKSGARQTRDRNRVRLRLEALEDRTVPALAHTTFLTLQGTVGTVTLDNTGHLNFATGVQATPQTLESFGAAFNVDGDNNLFDLRVNGDLWELPSDADPTSGWLMLDSNVGSMSVSASGVLEEVKMNGNLWRYANGAWNPNSALATGVTKADVDAAGNIYALIDGNLKEWAPGQATPTLLNNGTALAGNSAGDVVSFAVGGNTVAWQLGHFDVDGTYVDVSYTNGTSPNFITDNTTKPVGASIQEYAVDFAGDLVVRDRFAAVNAGVTYMTIGKLNVDTNTLDLAAGGQGHDGTSFQLSPDGTALAVMSSTNHDLTAYIIIARSPSQRVLDSRGGATSFGIANDLKVYEYSQTGTLQFYDLLASGGQGAPNQGTLATLVSSNVIQWQLGPNGEVGYLTTSGSVVFGATQISTSGAEIGFAPNGESYYLTTVNQLSQSYLIFDQAMSTTYLIFRQIDNGTAGFAVNSDSTLLDIKTNGRVWRLTAADGAFGMVAGAQPVNTIVNGWVLLYANANVGSAPGSSQITGSGLATQLVSLPDGTFALLANSEIIWLTADKATIIEAGVPVLTWANDIAPRQQTPAADTSIPGITPDAPAFNPLLVDGMAYSEVGDGIGKSQLL